MNKKSLALIILLLVIVGVYGAFYSIFTGVLMPADLYNYKSEIDVISQLKINNNSDISEMESQATDIETYSALSTLSSSERTNIANEMRSNANMYSTLLNDTLDLFNNDNYKSLEYALVLKGDVSNGINNISSTYSELKNINNEIVTLNRKMADDFEKGDETAYVQDLREMAGLTKQYNAKLDELKVQVQNVVNLLGG